MSYNKMEMIISNINGQYWTGDCWGVKQAAIIYDSITDIPETLDGMILEAWSDDSMLYYREGNDDVMASAHYVN